MRDQALLELRDLQAGYSPAVPILRGVSVSFPRRGLFLIIGPNGAGKSTLLRSIFGRTLHLGGSISYSGSDLSQLPPWERHSRGIVFAPQGRCNFPYMTVMENLLLGARRWGRQTEGIAREMLERYPRLKDRRQVLAGNLSGGEQQVLELSMALSARPAVLLVDEPSLGLAPNWQREIFAELRKLSAEILLLVVEQNVLRALDVADDVLVMEQGRFAFRGSPATLLHDPRLVEAYIGAHAKLRPGEDAETYLPQADPPRPT